MTNEQTLGARAGVETALAKLHQAIDGVVVDGFTGADLAQALLELSVTVAERAITSDGAKELARAITEADGAQERTPAVVAHRMLSVAVDALAVAGQPSEMIRHHMLAYVVAWTANAEGPAGAETLYRYADSIVSRAGAACP